jgi:tetratricopeptide (TPR) repeat protein
MKFKHAFMVLALLPAFAAAQKAGSNESSGGRRPVTSTDSLEVNQLYYSALHDKVIDKIPSATEQFTRVLQMDAGNDAAMYQLAMLLKAQNKADDAQSLLEKAVTLKADNEWYWRALADSYEKTNNIPGLSRVFDQLIRINPERADYYLDKANALYIDKKYDEALRVYDKLEQLTGLTDELAGSRQKVYIRQGKVDQAAAELERMLAASPGEVKYYLLLSELYNANNFNDKALKVLLRGEKVSPNNGMLHLALADVYRANKNKEESFKHLELAFNVPDLDIDEKVRIVLGYLPKFSDPNAKASALALSEILVKVHPDEAKAFALYGDMLMQNDKLKEARVAYKKSVTLNSSVYAVQEQLVRLELGENALDDAIKDGENALSLFPNQAWMNYLVGVAWMQKKMPSKAVGYLKNATSLDEQDKELSGQSYAALGDCYHGLNDNAKSDAAYEKSLSYNADNAYTLNNYAYYLSVRGEQLDKAARMSKHSNELEVNNASFEDTYAWILFKQKNYKEARLWIEKAITHKASSSVQAEHYGDILFMLGDTEAALLNWKKAKDLGGQSAVLDRKINEKKYIE